MKMLSELMTGYFDNIASQKSNFKILSEQCSPVVPQKTTWEVHQSPERFYREFIFDNKEQVIAFITEILVYEKSCNHSGAQRIDGHKVSVEVYTHDVNKITELDQEYSKNVGYIYEDVLSFGI